MPKLADNFRAEGYTELKTADIYVLPAGPRGLEFTSRTKSLHGAKVRIEGHMVRHFHEDAAAFLFTDVPASHNQAEYMLADSLPTGLVHVILPVIPGRAPAWRRERITVFGTLDLGSRQEIDGRISHVRLVADYVADAKTQDPIELRRPVALQRDRMASGVRTLFRPQKGDLNPTNQLLNTTQTSR